FAANTNNSNDFANIVIFKGCHSYLENGMFSDGVTANDTSLFFQNSSTNGAITLNATAALPVGISLENTVPYGEITIDSKDASGGAAFLQAVSSPLNLPVKISGENSFF